MLEVLRLSDLLKPLMATLNGVDTHFDSVSIDARTVERGGGGVGDLARLG